MLLPEFTTVAQTRNPPQRIPTGGAEKRSLGFGVDGKIDIFIIGGAEQSVVNNPEDLNFDSLSLSTFDLNDLSNVGLSPEQQKLYEKINQVCLLYSHCRDLELILGLNEQTDLSVIESLKHVLSDNVINKDQVVQEFIDLWNELATLDLAQGNHGTRTDGTPYVKPIFIYHERFDKTVENFIKQCAPCIMQSPLVKSILNKLLSGSNESLESLLSNTLLQETMTASMLQAFLHPKPANLLSSQSTKETKALQTMLFDPNNQMDLTTLSSFGAGVSEEIERNEVLFQRNRERELQRAREYRARSHYYGISPSEGSVDREQRRMDRTRGRKRDTDKSENQQRERSSSPKRY